MARRSKTLHILLPLVTKVLCVGLVGLRLAAPEIWGALQVLSRNKMTRLFQCLVSWIEICSSAYSWTCAGLHHWHRQLNIFWREANAFISWPNQCQDSASPILWSQRDNAPNVSGSLSWHCEVLRFIAPYPSTAQSGDRWFHTVQVADESLANFLCQSGHWMYSGSPSVPHEIQTRISSNEAPCLYDLLWLACR